ncbi:hypothetical protein RMA73_06595 [Xanthomonas translucens pv. translucens]|nr:hypothetical protein [Xanthomonas translucens]MCT8273442.1 hypothetical protein [Xanthomonas translucens pv. translucens]MCT8277587.1 hypothetical protein [Xanthomonas translucens pv. translucens]MCT8306507.1 hypothetical protein [Xanthomonas translucens pv. translucens]WNJ28266.1 hypothetical protein RMA73_06595 [Xanthomonas translucens pv. translucens]
MTSDTPYGSRICGSARTVAARCRIGTTRNAVPRAFNAVGQRDAAEAGDAAAADAAPAVRRKMRGRDRAFGLLGALQPGRQHAARAGIEHPADQLGVDLGHAYPGLAVAQFAGVERVFQFRRRAQYVLQVEHREVVAEVAEHLAQQRAGHRIEQPDLASHRWRRAGLEEGLQSCLKR